MLDAEKTKHRRNSLIRSLGGGSSVVSNVNASSDDTQSPPRSNGLMVSKAVFTADNDWFNFEAHFYHWIAFKRLVLDESVVPHNAPPVDIGSWG
jgi:hypothetical protein